MAAHLVKVFACAILTISGHCCVALNNGGFYPLAAVSAIKV